MLDDSTLADMLDSAVRESVVVVPADEIRRPRVNAAIRSGAWRQRFQISRLGVRAVSADSELPLLRLSATCRSLFKIDSTEEIDELAWILRGIAGDTTEERLEEFLRTSTPTQVIETLVLARRSNATSVCNELKIPIDQDNQALRDSILWKLGFPLPRSRDVRDEYWDLHNVLENLARTASVDLPTTADGLRAASSNYFVSLERFLFDSLCFATWALLTDHHVTDSPFVYFEHHGRSFTIDTLNSSVDPDQDALGLPAEPALGAIVEGFLRLSRLLNELVTRDGEFLRSKHELPKFSTKTNLQRFPFKHRHPFLDLTAESQRKLIDKLNLVGRSLQDSGILAARNGLLHAKQRVPTVGELNEALRKAREALDELESIGCVRSTFAVTSSQVNAWGGSTTTLSSNGRSISFSAPSPFEWTKLPSFEQPHYLMQGAVFAHPNEMLRFTEGFSSEYADYWAKYPRRPERGNRIVPSQSESLASSIDTGTYSSSRVG